MFSYFHGGTGRCNLPAPGAEMVGWTSEQSAQIRSQVERMTGCRTFAGAGRMSALLRYLVDAELDGQSDRLNQSRIAIDVLNRDGSFDPATDSIVRVEMGRLRSKLVEFYAADGAADPVVFELPRGRYRLGVGFRRPASSLRQRLRFCQSPDGTRIAYATAGDGYPLLKAANWLSHLEYDLSSPIWRHWWTDLARHFHLVRHDARGCGLSDREPARFSFEAWVEDLEAVADAAGPKRFALLGVSQGASVAVAYAARHPERVSHLILYGGFARGRHRRDDAAAMEESRALKQVIRVGWGRPESAFRQLFGSLFIPDGAREELEQFAELQRISCTPEAAERYWDVVAEIEVTDLLGRLRTPTLVMHVNDDQVVPFDEARRLAAAIADAQLVPLPGRNHVMSEREPAWPRFLHEMRGFVRA